MSIQTKKQIKKFKIEYFIFIVLLILVLILFLSGSTFNFSKDKNNEENNYESSTEKRLENLISKIDGVGETIVMITFDGSSEETILKNVETIVENGVKKTIETAVLVSGKPYVVKELNPKATSVIVVCEGADDLNVKLKITEVVKSTFQISSENIKIIKMK